jgi:hypothetical protein
VLIQRCSPKDGPACSRRFCSTEALQKHRGPQKECTNWCVKKFMDLKAPCLANTVAAVNSCSSLIYDAIVRPRAVMDAVEIHTRLKAAQALLYSGYPVPITLTESGMPLTALKQYSPAASILQKYTPFIIPPRVCLMLCVPVILAFFSPLHLSLPLRMGYYITTVKFTSLYLSRNQ